MRLLTASVDWRRHVSRDWDYWGLWCSRGWSVLMEAQMKKLDRYIDMWDLLEIDWPDTEKRKVGGDLFKKLNRAFYGLSRGQVAK